MSNYQELMQQAQALMAQANEIKENEKRETIKYIREKMALFGITPQELGGAGRPRGNKAPEKGEVKFRHPDGSTWSGRGRPPAWILEARKTPAGDAQFQVASA